MRISSEFETQTKLGQKSLSSIKLDFYCRDDITKFLLGLQHLSKNKEAMSEILNCLEESITLKNTGRRGMSLWRILVLGLLRQAINGDYDRLCNLSNNHKELRLFLGHGMIDSEDRYCLQTIKDNVGKLSKKVLDQINKIIVKAGHNMLDKRVVTKLNVKTDSFIVESNIHYPTDSNLLLDAMRCIIKKTAKLCEKHKIEGWRQSEYRIKKLKNLMRKATGLKRSTSKNEDKQQSRQLMIESAYKDFINESRTFLEQSKKALDKLPQVNMMTVLAIDSILEFMDHAERQIDQIHRRIILQETIPHRKLSPIVRKYFLFLKNIQNGYVKVKQEFLLNLV